MKTVKDRVALRAAHRTAMLVKKNGNVKNVELTIEVKEELSFELIDSKNYMYTIERNGRAINVCETMETAQKIITAEVVNRLGYTGLQDYNAGFINASRNNNAHKFCSNNEIKASIIAKEYAIVKNF